MNKQKGSVGTIGLVVVLALVGIGGYYYSTNHKKIEVPSNNPITEPKDEKPIVDTPPKTPIKTGISTQLNISKSLPQNLKIVSSGNNKFIAEGDYKGIKYRVGVNTTLRPDGKCIAEDYYYNSKTKVGAVGWPSISPDDHKSGDFKHYNCSPETTLDGFVVPMISSEVQDLYANTDGYMAGQTVQIAATTIKNNFYNQIYIAQNQNYSLKELDRYGNALESIFSRCLMPKYNGQALLKVGPNSGGCSPNYWQDSIQSTMMAGMDPDLLDYDIRKNFLALISNPGCKKDYVGDYLVSLSSNPQQFEESKFIKDLSCAGKITVEKGQSMPY
jgi:hypothetical protein